MALSTRAQSKEPRVRKQHCHASEAPGALPLLTPRCVQGVAAAAAAHLGPPLPPLWNGKGPVTSVVQWIVGVFSSSTPSSWDCFMPALRENDRLESLFIKVTAQYQCNRCLRWFRTVLSTPANPAFALALPKGQVHTAVDPLKN